jgi:superfamily II DNA or RNA helicase
MLARDVPRWVRSRMTLADLLAPEEKLLPFLGRKPLRLLREKAWAFLREEAESVREAIVAEGRPRQLPRDPTLGALSARLLELREKLRAEAAPRTLGRIGPHSVRLDPEQRRLVYCEQRKIRREIGTGASKPAVTLDLARHRAEPLPMPRCSCRGDPSCTHALAAVDSALAAMVDASHAEAWASLARALDEPEWARALRALEGAGAARRARLAQPESLVVSFRIGVLHGGHLAVTPYLHRRLQRGGYSAGTRAAPRQLAGGPSHLAPEDRPALESLGYLSLSSCSYPHGLSSSRNEAAAIEKLTGHPRVFFEDDPASPVTVCAATIGLALRPLDGGGFELTPTIGGEPVEAKGLVESLAELGPERLFFRIDKRNLRCQVVSVSAPEDAVAVVRALVAHGQRFPAEAEPLLFERLGLLQELLPVEVPASLQGEEVPAERHLVLELRLRASGLELRALARPLEGAPGHPPGEGPSRLSVIRDGRRIFVRRDTGAEETLAREVLASLPLDGAHAEAQFRQFRFVVPQDAEALEIVERLRAVDRPDVSVEWVGDPPRVVRAVQSRSLRVEVQDRRDWFGLSGEIEVDGERVALALLLEAIRERRRFVRLGGKAWLEIAGELAERLAPLAHLSQPGKEGVEIGPAAFSVLDDLERDGASLDARGAFATLLTRMRAASAEVPEVPTAFAAVLRDYQVDGFRWLTRLGAWGAGACLADDMGLGKTLQALALLCLRSGEGPALVVAPTSVCANWTKEAQRFAPSLKVTLYREADREGAVSRLEAGEVVVASYGLVTRDLERFKAVRFATLVLDEAQAVKNAATRRARAVRELDAAFRLALTGTPVENHLGELWSLYRIVFPGLLGSWDLFRERFAIPVERDRDPARRKALAAVLRPFLLRRTKGEVARELPTRTEIQIPVSLSPGERRLYDDTRLAAVARLANQEGGKPEQRRFQVLAAITKLRLLACHPRLHDAETALASSKLARFLSLVSDLKEGGHRALVFSQFTKHLSLVREALDADGASYLYLDGQTPPAQRDRLVERFQSGEGDLFLISLKAGGTGLNLTGADYVVHLDPWWNPAVEDQATDRAHRIGQTKPVTVYRLVAQGTIEEAIVSLHAEKRDLVAGVLDGMDSAGKLSPEQLMALIRAGPGEAGPTENECELEKASPLPPAWRAPSPAAITDGHAALIGRFQRHLREEYARGKLHSDGPAKSYPRAARRFLEFVALECGKGEPIDESLGSSDEFDDLVRRYLEALRTGRFPAPSSEPIVARTALRKLGDLMASDARARLRPEP